MRAVFPGEGPIHELLPPGGIDPRFLGSVSLRTESLPDVFATALPGEALVIPNYPGPSSDTLAVPSLAVWTHPDAHGLSTEARIVDLYPADPEMKELYLEAERARGAGSLAITVFGTVARMLQRGGGGANGLHHIRGTTVFPDTTIYHRITRKGPQAYLARIGGLATPNRDPVPVIGLIGVANDPPAQRRFFRAIGARWRER